MDLKQYTLYVSWRHVYEAIEALCVGADSSVNGHWQLGCSCPKCGSSVPIELAVAYNRRGYIVSHELSADQIACPGCGNRLSQRTLLYRGVQPHPVDEMAAASSQSRVARSSTRSVDPDPRLHPNLQACG